MTTQINVIVDNGGLSAKAKQQTQANRWAKLEGDNRQKVGAKGLQQRDANRLLSGIDANGRPLYGTPPAQQLRRDEPAAFRNTALDVMLTPLATPLGTTAINALTSAAGIDESKQSTALRYKEKFGYFYVVKYQEYLSALTSAESFLYYPFAPEEGKSSVARPNRSGLSRRLVLQTRGGNKGLASGSGIYPTIELWVYLPANLPDAPSGALYLELLGSKPFSNAATYRNEYRSIFGFQLGLGSGGVGGYQPNLSNQYLANYLGNQYVEVYDPGLQLPLGAWSHLAAQLRPGVVEYFVNGSKVRQVTIGGDGIETPDISPALDGYTGMVLSVRFDESPNTYTTFVPTDWWFVRGVRYTAKPRYDSGGFTPVHY